MSALLDRLRERKLVQWALAYLAGAWLLLQVLDVLGQNFDWPRAFFRSATIVLGVGFLAALVLAWYHGEKGRQRVSGPELLMLGALLVIAGGMVWLVGRSSAGAGADAADRSSPESGQLAFASAAPVERSIAVLPLANLSGDPENEYFSDGITDEILTTLAKVGDLRVISRTSVMRYKNTDKSLREIASELGVAHVLEGSVQRAGERVRINAQLIDASTDQHLWAERYDRPLEDIFAVQSEIAQQIARALQATLTPPEGARLDRRPTVNLTAHDYVLQARDYLRRLSYRDHQIALTLFRRALELDPTYADASAGIAAAFLWSFWWTGDRAMIDSAVAAGRRAVSLDPELAEGHAYLGWALQSAGDREAALEALLRAVELNPNLSEALAALATLYAWSFGRLDEAVRWWTRAHERDPINTYILSQAGLVYLHLGMHTQARNLLESAVVFDPGLSYAYYHLANAELDRGRTEEARAQLQRMLAAGASASDALIFAGHVTAGMDDLAAARRYLERGLAGAPSDVPKIEGTMLLAWILRKSGESERAQILMRNAAAWLDRRWDGSPRRNEDYVNLAIIRVLEDDREGALRAMDEGVKRGWRFINYRPNDPVLNSLRGNPHFDRLMAEVEADIARMRARVEREGW